MMKCSKMNEPQIQNFSKNYAVVESDVIEWDRELAVMDVDLYDYLGQLFQFPVTGLVQGKHYVFEKSMEVLGGQCAVPRGKSSSNPSTLLILK